MIAQLIEHCKNHKERIYRLSKESAWIVIGQATTVLGTLVLVRVLTEYLSPAEYGRLALGLTIAGLVNQVIMGGVVNGIGRFYPIAVERSDLRGYLRSSKLIMVYATILVVAIALSVMCGLVIFDRLHWLGLVAAVVFFSILSGYNSALNAIQNAARQRAIVALHGGLNSWLKIGLTVGIIICLGASTTAVLIGYALSALLVTGSQFYFLRRLMQRSDSGIQTTNIEPWAKKICLFSWPFSAWGLFTWGQQISDRWALEIFSTTHEVGQYAVLFQLGYTPISIATGLMTALVAPILFQKSGSATDYIRNVSVHRTVWRITGVSLSVTVLAFVFTLLFHGWLFRWLVSSSFQSISYYLPWVILAGGLFASGQLLSLKLMAEIRSELLLVVKIGTAILGIAANFIGGWLFGMTGVVAGLLIFSITYLFWLSCITLRLPKINAN